MAENHVHLDGDGVTVGEVATIETWMDAQIRGNANYQIALVSHDPNTGVLELSLAGDDAQAALAALFTRLPASLRAKITRTNVTQANARVKTRNNRSGSKPGRGRKRP